MSAERLREAARVLRERAEAVTDWSGSGEAPSVIDAIHHQIETEASTYIATMHPGVGLALADWLDGVAGAAERKGLRKFARGYKSALIVAEAILGGAS